MDEKRSPEHDPLWDCVRSVFATYHRIDAIKDAIKDLILIWLTFSTKYAIGMLKKYKPKTKNKANKMMVGYFRVQYFRQWLRKRFQAKVNDGWII